MSRMGDVRDLIRRIEAAGGRVVRCKRSTHMKVYLGPKLIGTLGSTPGDHRAIKNTISDFRKRGLDL